MRVSTCPNVFLCCRITLTLSCPMYIQNYPWDIQFCPMTLTSASYTANEMFLQWDKDERRMIAKDISILPKAVRVDSVDKLYCHELPHPHAGNLSCLNITFKLCRRMSASDIQMYVSSGLLSGLSCIAFLIPVDKTPARAGIGITTTISVITQCANAHANMPKVSYMTAMDIWMTGCLSFIVCTFI
uniref:Neurotransmitter-gated ion-channel transmembrane domain-containing protein n=1 Tax=Petromyzon marinus TaxID=7757 RepID=S4RA61_PETMA